MAYIPPNAEWYIAEIVQEITVEGDARNVVHRNLVLIKASSPEDAYSRSIELGQEGEGTYQNPAGRTVDCKFRGLSELNVVHEKLEHGTELTFWENLSVTENQIAKWVKSKEQLNVFRDIEPPTGPDCSSKDIVDAAIRLAPDLQCQK